MLMSSPNKVQSINSNGYNNLSQSQQLIQRNSNSLNFDNNFNINSINSNGNSMQSEVENVFNSNVRYLNKPANTNPITSGAYAAQNNFITQQQKNSNSSNNNFNPNTNNYNNNNKKNSFSNPLQNQNILNPLNNNNNFNNKNSNTLNVSLDEILLKIRQKLAQRGTTGILSIGKSFKINDIDNSRSISFAEFSNLCSRYGLGLSSNEIRSAFALFDKRRNGFIDYEEFLGALRGGLNPFRRNLVDQAFNLMDKNKNGFIEYNDIISAFDATKHPAVAKGDRTAESVYNEFLASFSMNHSSFAASKGNGFKISREEWAEYYENVSMSIDDDKYFEHMMNNCWRMNSHAMQSNNVKGWANRAENSADYTALQENYNKRYNNFNFGQNRVGYNIVTNKLPVGGINNNNNNNVNVSNNNNNYNNVNFNNNNNQTISNNNFSTNMNSNITNQALKQTKPLAKNNIINGKINIPPQANAQRALEKGHAVLEKFRQKLFARGSNSLISLAKQFKIGDDDNSKSLNFEEFVKICKDFRTELTQSEALSLFTLFDRNRNNLIDYDEFLRAVKGEMNEKRKALVLLAFAALDADKSGVVEIQDLKNKYNMRKNPEVLSGRKSEEEAYGEFLQTLEFHFNIYKGKMDRKITLEEFDEYYNNVSCSIDSDEYFETVIRNAWNLDRIDYNRMHKGWAADYAGNGVAGNSGFANLNVNVNAAVAGNNLNNFNNPNNYENANMNINDNYNPYNNSYIPQQNQNIMKQPSYSAASVAYNNPVNDPIMQRLREKILSRGIKGIIGIQRSFKIADRNRTGMIDNEELVKLLKNYRFDLSDVEFRKLFEIFDSDRSGKVDFNEFLYGIVGEMNEFRKDLVKKAFGILDKTGNGRVDIDDIRGNFNARMHPDVKSGKKTEDEVLSAFLDNFETHFSHIVNRINFCLAFFCKRKVF